MSTVKQHPLNQWSSIASPSLLADLFPALIRTIFAENCVAVVFLSAIIMNLIMPKEKEAK